MESLYWLDRIQASQANIVGEKAAALSQLWPTQSVSPGFAISSTVMRSFLERVSRSELLLADLADSRLHLDLDDSESLRAIARRVRASILKTELPSEWFAEIVEAVRGWQTSSAIVRPSLILPPNSPQDFAGLMRSRVCACQADALEFAIKWVWAERFRAGTLLCLAKASTSETSVDLALLIQPIFAARTSGLVEISGSEARIYSAWGLGHSIARGEVRPDCDRVRLDSPTEAREVRVRQLGQKVILYRPHSEMPTSESLHAEHLQVEPTSETQQNTHCLSEAELEELLALTQKLTAVSPQHCYWEWTQICQGENNAPRFAIVQCSSRGRIQPAQIQNEAFSELKTFPPSEFEGNDPAAPLRGLPASPGRASALAESITDWIPSSRVPPGRILVAKAISPEWLPLLEGAAGIVTEQGGVTSHAAIIARELGIPAIVGVRDATSTIQSGEGLLIDGTKGKVRRQMVDKIEMHAPPEALVSPSPPPFPIGTQLLLNLSQLQGLSAHALLPVDGIGLLRSELAIVSLLEAHPLHWWLQDTQRELFVKRLSEQILQFAREFFPRPVFYRSSDWRSREFSPEIGETRSGGNPILGRRGTFTYTLNPTLFEAELAALARVQARGYGNLSLILPFVRAIEEFVFCRDRIEKIGLPRERGFQLWIMAEVPSVSYLLPEYVKAGVQGISIGTNDLTQLLLGVDRERAELAELFDERHPAVLTAVRQLIELAHSLDIPCSICGQAPVLYPETIDLFVRWGITAISVEAGAVEQTYWAIARAERRLLLEAARRERSLPRDRRE